MLLRCFFCGAILLFMASCQSPDLQVMTALNASWDALRPYTEAGIRADGSLAPDARETLLDEVHEFTLTLEQELRYAK